MDPPDPNPSTTNLGPTLTFTRADLRSTIQSIGTANTLLITDPYNLPCVRDLGSAVVVEDTDASCIEKVVEGGGYSGVIAIGGCSALDFARACASGMCLTAVPTILSSCCISSGYSVIRRDGVYAREETTAPRRTIVSLPTILENHANLLTNWSAAGLGDLLSAIAGVAEANWSAAASQSPCDIFTQNAPICSDVLRWIASSSFPLDEAGLIELAKFLHEFSVSRHESMPAGSEHCLYYALRTQQNYSRMLATHGRLVSIGTLLTIRAWSEASGDFSMYHSLRAAYAKIGLPLTLDELRRIGVAPEHIVAACRTAMRGSLYEILMGGSDASLISRVFEWSCECLIENPIEGWGWRGNACPTQ
jgi:glycerol dehydrogenase-like iron-containing ADH family enzyme